MRISDWSSDVCSSDLPIAGEFDHAAALRAVPGVERQGRRFDRNFFIFAHIALPSLTRQDAALCRPVAMPPLSREPESFPPCAPVGEWMELPLRWFRQKRPKRLDP